MRKKKITLEFKAEYFKAGGYIFAGTCAITRALKNANIDAEDIGTQIRMNNTRFVLTNEGESDYRELVYKVMSMYSYLAGDWGNDYDGRRVVPVEPHDFTHELEINVF